MSKLRVAVVCGGEGGEREVSLNSGKTMQEHLDTNKYEAILVDVPRELEKLQLENVDVCLLGLHGGWGENGTIQGYLEMKHIPYTGSGVLASALAMNKRLTKVLAARRGVTIVEEVTVPPCVIKPVGGGSSVGVTIARTREELQKAIVASDKADIVIERYISGMEVSCGVLGNTDPQALPVIEIKPKNYFFDYESKYKAGMCEEVCPARIDSQLATKIQEDTIKVFSILGCRGYARADFIISEGIPYFLEINTLPGMTPTSLLPQEAKATGMSYGELLNRMIELAFKKDPSPFV